jgi:HAD superfamily hydrolase (TIGR01509 family)
MRPDTLFLDAGGVLVHPNWARVSETLARHGVRVQPEALAAAEPHVRRELDVPARISTTTDASRGRLYHDLVLARAGVELGPATRAALTELAAYHARLNLWETVPPEVPRVLRRLRAAGLRLVVVSNSNGTLERVFERLGLAAAVDHALDSHIEGVEKPDPRIFHRALERAGARPERTVHVGDLYHVDVLGARSAGLEAMLFDPHAFYVGVDCPRVASLEALADLMTA